MKWSKYRLLLCCIRDWLFIRKKSGPLKVSVICFSLTLSGLLVTRTLLNWLPIMWLLSDQFWRQIRYIPKHDSRFVYLVVRYRARFQHSSKRYLDHFIFITVITDQTAYLYWNSTRVDCIFILPENISWEYCTVLLQISHAALRTIYHQNDVYVQLMIALY